jgi:ribosome-associated protein
VRTQDQHFEGFDAEPEEESRSAHKREAQAIRRLVEEVADLGEQSYASLNLPDDLREALNTARKLRPRSDERRRQLQYAARIQRGYPESDLAEQVRMLGASEKTDPDVMRFEKLRAELISSGIDAVNSLCRLCPQLDRRKLLSLVNKAKAEAKQADDDEQLPRPAARTLFKYVKTEVRKAGIKVPDTLLQSD